MILIWNFEKEQNEQKMRVTTWWICFLLKEGFTPTWLSVIINNKGFYSGKAVAFILQWWKREVQNAYRNPDIICLKESQVQLSTTTIFTNKISKT